MRENIHLNFARNFFQEGRVACFLVPTFSVVFECIFLKSGCSPSTMQAITVRASNDLRFLENAWMSRVLQHLTETRDSMSTVRCYGAVNLVCRHFYRLLDGATRPFWATTACVRFTRVSGGGAGLLAVLALVLTVVLSASPLSQSGVGLALSSVISVSNLLMEMTVVMKKLNPRSLDKDG